jgi:hypothetical protein
LKSTTELAWAAGFFDGEGSTSLSHKKGTRWATVRMSIGQTSPIPLERFQRAVGGLGKIHGPRKVANPNAKPQWYWTVAKSEDLRKVIDLLWEFLCEPKRQQILAAEAKQLELNPRAGYARGKWPR